MLRVVTVGQDVRLDGALMPALDSRSRDVSALGDALEHLGRRAGLGDLPLPHLNASGRTPRPGSSGSRSAHRGIVRARRCRTHPVAKESRDVH